VDERNTNSNNTKTLSRKYIPLKQLTVGTYLTVFNRSKWTSNKNYNLLKVDYFKYSPHRNRKDCGKIEEHKFIMQQLEINVPDRFIIHHKDHNKDNNSINNLEVLDAKEHDRQHTKSRGFYGREVWEKNGHPKGFLGHKHTIKSRNEISQHLYDVAAGKEYVPERIKIAKLPAQSFMIFKNSDHAEKSGIKSREGYVNVDRIELKDKCSRNGQIRYFDKIVSIKYYGKSDVYDMEVEDNHNFIANGIFVHNCGKTVMAIEVLKYVREVCPDANILIVAPKIVILETVWLKELYKAGFTPNMVGVYYGYAHEFSKITLTTIASIPRLDMGLFDFIIADEIHNMMSPNLIKLLKYSFKYKLGLSASIKHISQKHWKLIEYFHYNVFEYNMRQAITDGIINKFNFHLVSVKITDEKVRIEYDRCAEELKDLLAVYGGFEKVMRLPATDSGKCKILSLFTQRNDLVNNYIKKVDVVCEIIRRDTSKKTLLFSQYNKITRAIYWGLKDVTRAEIIDTHVKESKRKQFLQDFEEGKYNVLLSSRIFEEGYNLPQIDQAIFLSSNSTSRQMIQRLGRILRKKDKPSDAYYIYCKDTFEEDYANRAKEFVEDIAEQIILEEH
jgi:superfamily II DNA or RNA helicase